MDIKNEKACLFDYSKELAWERGFLKKKCEEVGVEEEYVLYERRRRCNSLGVFLFLHSAVTLFHCTLLLTTCEYREIIYIDVMSYLGNAALTILVLSINFNEDIVRKHAWIMYATSATAVLLMVAVDLTLHLYHYYENYWTVSSFYDTYVLIAVYLFLPIPFIIGPLVLGCVVTITYIIYFYSYLASKYQHGLSNVIHINHMLVDLLHFVCFNLLGIFYRVISDVTVRSSFLDRHQFVMEEVWLRSARKQEKLLLHSILPPQIARPFQEDIRSRIAISGRRRGKRIHNLNERIMAIQNHPEVSILYADVVNYTHLTTTLSVNALVTLLHDLYGRFDVAASHFKVQRIKFLGDCYYCVAGLFRPDPDHAKCCVDLGHCMIAHIREVRANRNLNIDMRIGVHSGTILAGAIGSAKLQFDIWGDDVTIANLLESTGLPGYIHISERTLGMMIDHSYQILPGTQEARDDPYLLSHGVHTFLIEAVDISTVTGSKWPSQASIRQPDAEPIKTVEEVLRSEFAKMPVGSFHIKKFFNFWRKTQSKDIKDRSLPLVGFLLLHFADPRLEYNYMRQPDYMLRYSLLMAWCVGLSLIYIQIVDHGSPDKRYYFVDGFVMLIMTLQLIITWYKKLCYRIFKENHSYSYFSCRIFRISDFLQRNLISRLCIYMSTITAYFTVIYVVLLDCDQEEFEVLHIESKLYHYEPDLYMCFHPWVLTNMVCLIMAMSMIFTRIPWMYEYVMHHSVTTNPYLLSEYAHTMSIAITLIALYFMERQAEFNNKVNFNWRTELLKKQQDAYITNKSITILLQNILPAHVVNVYLTSLAKHELYYEDYEMVAVMFASLKNFELDLPNLRILNEIICEFDKILSYYRQDFIVEKIKIVGCTYMAACGLDTRFSGRLREREGTENSLLQEVSRAQRFFASFHSPGTVHSIQNEEVVYVLTTFALDLMRTLWTCSNVYNTLPINRRMYVSDICIGISSGEVMAGVVGASQVHYDIWGNPVNMASRMYSTGKAGQIHVTEETAKILNKYGIQCDYRGMTYVKGRGRIPTYFVGIDEDHEFKHTAEFSQQQDQMSLSE